MKLGFTEINGKAVKVSELEYLYTYINDNNDKIAVFEFEGNTIEKIIKNDDVS
jgi:hypothetical protein